MRGVSVNPHPGAGSESESVARSEAGRAGEPFLLYRDGQDREQLFTLEAGLASVSVGRGHSADLALDWDQQVSRLHARLERVEDGWELVDDGLSRHGTFVNGRRISGRCRLTDGDAIRIGATATTFRSPGAEEAVPAVADEAPAGVDLSTTQRRVLVALCRPYRDGAIASPGTDQQIADELFMPVGVVRTHLRVLFAKLGVDRLPTDQKRAGLVERAFADRVISERDF